MQHFNIAFHSEHVKRHHTPTYNCMYCGHRWPATDPYKAILIFRDAHIKDCKQEMDGAVRAHEREIMNESQEEQFSKLKHIRSSNNRKLRELYRACGKPLPATYRG